MLEYLNKYECLINTSETKENIKELVRKMFYDNNINDRDFHDILEMVVYPKLKQLGVDIPPYNEETNESLIETILRENY